LAQGAARANAMNNTRQQAEQLGWAKRMDVTALGRNLPGLSNAAYAGALNSGNSAGQNSMSAGNNLLGQQAAAAGLHMQGANMQMSGLSNILGQQTSIYQSDQARSAANAQALGQGIGTIAGFGLFR
jgi:hypothetical protein